MPNTEYEHEIPPVIPQEIWQGWSQITRPIRLALAPGPVIVRDGLSVGKFDNTEINAEQGGTVQGGARTHIERLRLLEISRQHDELPSGWRAAHISHSERLLSLAHMQEISMQGSWLEAGTRWPARHTPPDSLLNQKATPDEEERELDHWVRAAPQLCTPLVHLASVRRIDSRYDFCYQFEDMTGNSWHIMGLTYQDIIECAVIPHRASKHIQKILSDIDNVARDDRLRQYLESQEQ